MQTESPGWAAAGVLRLSHCHTLLRLLFLSNLWVFCSPSECLPAALVWDWLLCWLADCGCELRDGASYLIRS